jgi:hypothetical protein
LLVIVAVLFTGLASPGVASAGKIEDLAKQLASDDFRVRTQAALTLGATADGAAVKPLCGAVGDSNQTVRLAVVAALGKLGKDEGAACLRRARGSEKDSAVTTAIDKSLEKIAVGGDPPPPRASAKYYVSIQVTNKTKRPSLEVEGLVRKAMQEKLLANPLVAIAPRGETNQAAAEIIKNKKLTGYLLIASVEPFDYSGGALKVQLKVSMFTYPDRALKAEFGPWLKQTGTPSADPAGETNLIKMTSGNAADQFVKVANSL